MSTADMTTGQPGPPAGCGAGCIVVAIVALLIGAFVAAIYFMLKSMGQL
jgi:hypothetical protein